MFDDSLPIYLAEIGAISLLTPDEETSLAQAIACGKEAQRQLVADEVPPRRGRLRCGRLPAGTRRADT